MNEEVSVAFSAIDITAGGDSIDYLLNAGSATFAAADNTTDIEPLIVNDTLVELPDETFKITLSSPDAGLSLGTDIEHTFTILNDDIEVTATTDEDTIGACGATTANLGTTVLGTGPYTYAWTPTDSLSDPAISNPVADPSEDTWYKVTVTDQTNGAVGVDSVKITVLAGPGKPVITTGGATTFCDGDSVLLSSSPGVTYLWSNGAVTQDIYAKIDGSYTVRVYDEFGCESEASDPEVVTVNSLPGKPNITPDGATTFCQGDSVDLEADAASGYLWSTGASTQTIRVKIAGKYAVQVINAAGCYSPTSDSTEVIVNSLPAKPDIAGLTEYCQGDSVRLDAPASDSYLWSTGETTSFIYVNAGTYTLTVSNANGCGSPSSDPHTVTENSLPARPVISGMLSYCEGGSTNLTSTAADSYLWSNGSTSGSVSVTAGVYWLNVTDLNGCTSLNSDTVTVTELPMPSKPVITANGPVDFWLGDSVVLSSSPANSYLWTPGGETSQDITARDSGDYTVTITDANGCMSDPSDPFLVIVRSLAKPTVTVTGDTEYCEGESSTLLRSSSAVSYRWSTGDTTREIQVTASGSYTVQIFDDFGHPSSPSDAVTVTIHPLPDLSLLSTANATCNGESSGSADLLASGGTAPYVYDWNSGHTGAQVSGLPAGNYRVILSDAEMCRDTVNLSIDEPTAILISDSITHPFCADAEDGSVSVSISGGTPGYTLLWSDGSNGNSLADLSPGTVSISVTDANNCELTADYDLLPTYDHCIFIPDIITPNNDNFNDVWIIRGLEYYTGVSVEIYDRWGKPVYHSQGYDIPWDGTMDGIELPMDSYHYIIRIGNTSSKLVGNITIIR